MDRFFALSLSLSLMIWGSIVKTLHAQSLPFGIIIASTEEFAPNGEGYSLDATFNNILIGYDVTYYEKAYPFAKSDAAKNCFEIRIDDSARYISLAHLLDSLQWFDEVLLIREDSISECSNPAPYDDPGVQGGDGYFIEMTNLPCAWAITPGDPNCIIAIPDVYFDYSHDDLEDKFFSISSNCNSNLSSCHHGFLTAGAAAAIVNNDFCAAGSGRQTRVAGYCVGSSCKFGSPGQGVTQAYQDGHKIISVSWNGISGVTKSMVEEMVANGVTIVHSTHGNSWSSIRNIPGVIGVGQVNASRDYVPYDVWEPEVDIYAPCLDVLRLIHNNSCAVGSGNTSFGAPLVAGIIALMKSVNQDLCPADYQSLLSLTHQGLPGNANEYPEMTAGIVDAEAAVLAAQTYQKYTIDSYVVWDEDKVVNELILEAGGDLRIENGATIRFGANARVIIKRGARMVVDGSILTVNSCSGDQWPGIEVWGNFDELQPDPYISTLDPDLAGILIIKGGSIVEKVKDAAISLKSRDAYWNTSLWGGLVIAENSIFRENVRVAEFMKYDLPNASRFFNCTFDGLRKGITIWSNKGIEFEQCRFYNMTEQGLLLWDAQVRVTDGNDFHYNNVGIRSMATHPFSGLTIVGADGVDPNYFLDNFLHIRSEATSFGAGLWIVNNEFFNGNTAVTILGPSSYHVRDNAIVDPVVGVYSFQSGGVGFDQHNYVDDNAISGLIGVIAEGKNKELQVRCNLFDARRDFMIRQAGNTSSGDQGEIREHQGSNKGGANNCFTNPTQISDIETSGQTLHFNYWVSGTATCLTPVTPGNYTVKGAQAPSCNNLLPPFSPPTYSHYVTLLDTIIVLRQSNPGSDTLARMVEYKDYVRNYIVAKALDQDSVDIAFYLLDQDSSQTTTLIKYGIAASRGLIQLADSVLMAFPNDDEMSAFKATQSIYLDWIAGDYSTYPGTTDSLYLEDMAVSDFSVGAYARSMLSLFFGRVFDELPEFDEEYFAEERSSDPQSESPIQKIGYFKVFPNPARDMVTIRNYFGNELDMVTLINTLGVKVSEQPWPSKAESYDLYLNNMHSGIYAIQLSFKGRIVYTELLSIQK